MVPNVIVYLELYLGCYLVNKYKGTKYYNKILVLELKHYKECNP